MVLNNLIQNEINKIESKYYPCRFRPFQVNLKVKPLTGKFYARHDFPDPSLLDESFERMLVQQQMFVVRDECSEPETTNMEYGWYSPPEEIRQPFTFHYPKRSTWVTKIGAVIALEEQKHPKKPFIGVPFKLV